MTTAAPDDVNPYEAPRSATGASSPIDPGDDPEATRRAHLGRESAIWSVGLLCSVLAGFGGVKLLLLGVAGLVALLGARRTPDAGDLFLAMVTTSLLGTLGYGLLALRPWARWLAIALMVLNVATSAWQVVQALPPGPTAAVAVLLASLVPAYILYLVAPAPGALVFSAGYREVVARTPQVEPRMSLIAKILLPIVLIAGLADLIGAVG